MIFRKFSSLFRHPLIVLVCTRGLGQSAVLVSTFFLARLVTPSVYGELGLFTSLCALLSMASGARFEIRALICRTERARKRFVAMAYAVNVTLFLCTFPLAVAAAASGLVPAWVALVPLGVAFSSLVTYVFPSQNSSSVQLPKLGRMNLAVSFGTAVMQIAAAKIAPVAISLVIARLAAMLIGIATMKSDVSDGLKGFRELSKSSARRIYRASRQEIYYGSSSALLGVLELQCAAYVLTFFMKESEVGMYWMGFNLLFVPFFVISGSIRPLFLRHLSSARKRGNIQKTMLKYTGMSFGAGLFFVTLLVLAVTLATQTFLGPEWQDVNYFVVLLGVTLLALITRLPISFAASALRLQRLNLAFGLVQTAVRIVSLSIPLYLGSSVYTAMKWFTFAASGCYLIHIAVSIYFLKQADQ